MQEHWLLGIYNIRQNMIQNYSAYVDIDFNPKMFLEDEIPKYHPLSISYRKYWAEQRRRCIEGHWVGGR